ncbi:zinc-binding dehydrogenase, partial [Microbacterium sp. Kw_RZR3]|nr:zinc-binding dehydrogenase [Microbacterium sp. Kw_RZR3]
MMKAAVTLKTGKGFTTTEIRIADPIGREVLVDVKASGLCLTDHSLMANDFGFPLPAVFGHELAGVVTAVGPDVTEFQVGDHVVGCLVQWCGRCQPCIEGIQTDCLNPLAVERSAGEEPRLVGSDGPIYQGMGLGGFAEKALVHENQLARVNDEIPFSRAALLGCGTVTGAGAVINSAKVAPGDTVAVIGTGGVGLNAIAAARLAGAKTIIAVDIQDTKLDMATRFGATHVVNSRNTDPVEEIRRISGGGVDYAFEIIGLPATQMQAIAAAKTSGTAVLVGMGKPGAKIEIETSAAFLATHKTIKAVMMGSTNLKRDIPFYADMYVAGRYNLDDLVTNEISIDEIDEAYDSLASGTVIRSVITRF